MSIDKVNLKDFYEQSKIYYWPCFSSTTKNRRVAENWSRKDNKSFIFEIFVSENNYPYTNIDLPRDWSFYPTEEEVLLLPFFCF